MYLGLLKVDFYSVLLVAYFVNINSPTLFKDYRPSIFLKRKTFLNFFIFSRVLIAKIKQADDLLFCLRLNMMNYILIMKEKETEKNFN